MILLSLRFLEYLGDSDHERLTGEALPALRFLVVTTEKIYRSLSLFSFGGCE